MGPSRVISYIPMGVDVCDMLNRLEHALGHAAQERTPPLHEHGVERPPPRERELYHGAHVHRIERPIAAHTAAVLALLPAERELFTEGYRPSELANRTGDAVG